MKKIVGILLMTMTLFFSCKKNDENNTVHVNDKFELHEAKDWTLINEQGIDTYVGFYLKDGYRIDFDFGFLSFRSIDDFGDPEDYLYYEELVIDSCQAVITKEQRSDGIRLSAYIDKGDDRTRNRLYTFNTSNDELFKRIVKSHQFK